MAKKKAAGAGHNSTGEILKNTVARIEKLNDEKSAIGEDMKEVYSSAVAQGLDAKIIKKIVRLRAVDRETLKADNELTSLYLIAMGENELMEAFA